LPSRRVREGAHSNPVLADEGDILTQGQYLRSVFEGAVPLALEMGGQSTVGTTQMPVLENRIEAGGSCHDLQNIILDGWDRANHMTSSHCGITGIRRDPRTYNINTEAAQARKVDV
jgi:hypothetical protein